MYQFVFDMNLRTYVRLNPLPKDIKVVGLGDSPQNCNIPILESNKAIVLNQVAILNEANKENINVSMIYNYIIQHDLTLI